MNCKKVKNQISLYLNDELLEKGRKELASHLSRCPSCQAEFNELQSLHHLLTQVTPVNKMSVADDEFLFEVRRKIRSRYHQAPVKRFFPRLIPVFATAALLLIVALGSNIYRTKQLTETESVVLGEKTSAEFVYDNLETNLQSLVNDKMLNNISTASAMKLESEIMSSSETEELINNFTDKEKEDFIKTLINNYTSEPNKSGSYRTFSPGGDNA